MMLDCYEQTYRGFSRESNWVIKKRLMVGAHPDVHLDMDLMINCGITDIVCLESKFNTHLTTRWGDNERKK